MAPVRELEIARIEDAIHRGAKDVPLHASFRVTRYMKTGEVPGDDDDDDDILGDISDDSVADGVLDDAPSTEERVAAARAEIIELQTSITDNNASKMDMIARLQVGRKRRALILRR